MPSKAELLLHPVRLRIVTHLINHPQTALELSKALPDVGQSTVYRHINKLAAAGLIDVVEERQAHSNVEKVYGVGLTQAHLTAEDVRDLSKDEHMQMFTVFAVTLLTQWEQYLDTSPQPDMQRDQAGYTQVALWLTDEEFTTLVEAINAAVGKALNNTPGEGRTRRLLSTVVMPSPEQEDDSDGND